MTAGDWFIGIDGGGTKTDVALVDADGTIACRLQGPTSNKAIIGVDKAISVLRTLVDDAVAQVGISGPLRAGWIGLAGSDRTEDQEQIRLAVRDRIVDIRITNDAELVLSGNQGGIGIALIGGTGSIAFARNEAGVSGRSGGWGHIFGDEGSAYQLGVDGLRAAAAAADGRGPNTQLSHRLLTYWQAPTPQHLILKVYDTSVRKSDIADSASVIVEAARDGDIVATHILVSAGVHLSALVRSLLRRIPFSTPPSVAVTGGLILNAPEIREHVRQGLIGQPCRNTLVLVDDVVVSAAQAIRIDARKGDGTG